MVDLLSYLHKIQSWDTWFINPPFTCSDTRRYIIHSVFLFLSIFLIWNRRRMNLGLLVNLIPFLYGLDVLSSAYFGRYYINLDFDARPLVIAASITVATYLALAGGYGLKLNTAFRSWYLSLVMLICALSYLCMTWFECNSWIIRQS
jgi:hypothetical protein